MGKNLIDNAFQEFILDCKIRNLSESTIEGYREKYYHFIKAMDVDTIEEITPSLIKQYQLQLLDSDYKVASINSYLRHLRAIFNWYLKEDIMSIPSKIKLMKEVVEVKETFTEEELNRLLIKPSNKDNELVWRNWMAINMLVNTGMRASTLLAIKIEDIDTEQQFLKARHNKNKREQLIPLNTQVTKALLSYIRMFKLEKDMYLISSNKGKELQLRGLYQALNKYHKDRGVEKTGIHIYRRTFITDALARGVDSLKIAKVVGHSDLQMINKHYWNSQVEHLRSVVE